MIDRKMPRVTTPMMGRDGDKAVTVAPEQIFVTDANDAVSFKEAAVLKVAEPNLASLDGAQLEGKIVLTQRPDFQNLPEADRAQVYQRMREFVAAVNEGKARVLIFVNAHARLVRSQFVFAEEANHPAAVVLQVNSPELGEALKSSANLTLSLDVPAPTDQKAVVKNVIGILKGSDPKLRSTCVLVTAHYDHIGTTATAQGLTMSAPDPNGKDKIYNGANDDGSGTVSVIEIARGLSELHPRRSIVFMTFFGEERGLLGSTYYGRHPVFPIAKTVADINLEQVGRTDSSEGPEISNASITGYDYSDVTKYLERAGKATGVSIYKDAAASDQYFVRSDNAALAEQGVPAHTLTTAFEYPDYHGLGDEWQKIDYNNMAKVDRTVALAVLNIANASAAPEWNAENPKTKPFRDARAAGSK